MLLPGVLLGGGFTWALANRAWETALGELRANAHSAALKICAELEASVSLLNALASSPYLDPENRQLEAFRRQARDAVAPIEGYVVFFGAENPRLPLVSTSVPAGQQIAAPPRGVGIEAALQSGKPVFVGPVYIPSLDRSLASILVPVLRGGRAIGVLGMPLMWNRLQEPFRSAPGTLGSSAFLLTPDNRLIARDPDPERVLARTVTPWIIPAIGDQTLGILRGEGLDGDPAVMAFERLPLSGWFVVVSATEEEMRARWLPALLEAVALIAAVLIPAGILGWAMIQRLMRPMSGLLDGAAVPETGPRVLEFEALAAAVIAAQNAPRREAEVARRAALENLQLAREAEDERRLLKSVVQSVPEAIFVKDTELRYVLVNRAGAGALGRTEDEVLGRTDGDLTSPELARELEMSDRAMMNTGITQEYENRMMLPGHGGEARTYLTVKGPWRDSMGRIAGLVSVARDVTLRRTTEERLRAAEEAMRRIARADTLAAMGVGVAHELNQPLTAMANFLRAGMRWLQEDSPDPARIAAAREAMQEAAAQALRAGEIVRRLRDFIGRGETEQKIVSLGPLVADGVALTCAAHGEESLPIALDLAISGCVVRADEVQLQQVFVNLLRNAIEATEGQEDRGLSVSLKREDGNAVLLFTDAGPGFSPEVRERLFQPFVSTKEGGMGIGLAICRTIIEAHSGQIEILPREGRGTVIRIELPLVAAKEDA